MVQFFAACDPRHGRCRHVHERGLYSNHSIYQLWNF